MALGAYFWGYLIMCFPGGYVADKFGATRINFLATLIGSILTALIPLCAMVHVWVVIIVRFIIGFTAVGKSFGSRIVRSYCIHFFRGFLILPYSH